MDIYQALGTRIREIRKERGISQEIIASRAGISTSFLSHIERGTKKSSLDTVERLAKALGLPVGDLFEKQEPSKFYSQPAERQFSQRIEGFVREKGAGYKKVLWKVAKYLAEQDHR